MCIEIDLWLVLVMSKEERVAGFFLSKASRRAPACSSPRAAQQAPFRSRFALPSPGEPRSHPEPQGRDNIVRWIAKLNEESKKVESAGWSFQVLPSPLS